MQLLIKRLLPTIFVAFATVSPVAQASPWAEVGDAQLRSDLNILAAAGVTDNITTQWPIPWAGLLDRLNDSDKLDVQPAYIRAAAKRVLAKANKALDIQGVRFTETIDGTNLPNVVYGFDGLGRQYGQEQISGEFVDGSTAGRLSLGGRTLSQPRDKQRLVLDDSYVAQRIGNAIIYGGYVTHWWGPGWISALQLSNNARPFPQIGISRLDTSAFRTPWLSWLGPWQLEFFAGLLDGPRKIQHTFYDGLRLTFNPMPGLELGLSRTDELCGSGRPCNPIQSYFNLQNSNTNPDTTNDEFQMDARYTNVIHSVPFEIYTAVMNEDGPNPIVHSVSSHQVGASVWIPLGSNVARLTAEFTDSVPTIDIFSFGSYFYGDTYNDYKYTDGMRYRGRTLGFSLDSDSQLISLQASTVNSYGVTYTLTLDHAYISDRKNQQLNVVTSTPALINLGEAKVTVPMHGVTVGLAARLQDDQPRPQQGFVAAGEISFKFNL